jgi:hypothetical protein
MTKRTLDQLEAYAAPGHYGMTAMRIAGKAETGNQKFWLGLSNFLPGGGAEWVTKILLPKRFIMFLKAK